MAITYYSPLPEKWNHNTGNFCDQIRKMAIAVWRQVDEDDDFELTTYAIDLLQLGDPRLNDIALWFYQKQYRDTMLFDSLAPSNYNFQPSNLHYKMRAGKNGNKKNNSHKNRGKKHENQVAQSKQDTQAQEEPSEALDKSTSPPQDNSDTSEQQPSQTAPRKELFASGRPPVLEDLDVFEFSFSNHQSNRTVAPPRRHNACAGRDPDSTFVFDDPAD